MNLKGLRSQAVTDSMAERLFLRCFALALVLSAVPFLQYWSGSGSIFLEPIWGSLDCEEAVNLTATVVRELTSKQLLDQNAKALCVGQGSAAAVYALHELGFANASGGTDRHPFFLPRQKKFMYELEFGDHSFDFVFSGDLDKVPVPASLVLEIERVLKPGGVAAALIGGSSSNGLIHYNLIRSAMPISSLLKTSSVVHVGYLDGGYTLVVFKKRFYSADYFDHFTLPSECHSVANNGLLMQLLEPVAEAKPVGFEEKIAYLPKLMDVSSRTRMVYVDIGVGEHLKLNSSIANWYLPAYPVDHKAFNVYLVDHNTSVLHSFVKRPGVTFVYHPGLAGDKADRFLDIEDLDPFIEDQGFDFVAWFEETVKYADFVVMRLNAGGEAELKFLVELVRTGAICSVDELFLNCAGKGLGNGECGSLVRSLRASGVFVHQWW